jgi:exportin-1
VASSLGPFFFPQISLIFLDMLTVYRYFCFCSLKSIFYTMHLCDYSNSIFVNKIRMYSELVSNTIAEGGPYASKTSFVKLLR